MYFLKDRIRKLIDELQEHIYSETQRITTYKFKKGNFKSAQEANADSTEWQTFEEGDRWGGRDVHYWFRTEFDIPEKFADKTVVFDVKTGREGDWDAKNPQFIIYVNGKLIQGLDVNHTWIVLPEDVSQDGHCVIDLHSYSGMNEGLAELKSSISILNRNVEKLYYDIKVPYNVAILLDEEDKRRIDILNYLNDAVNLIDFRKPFSQGFFSSIDAAVEFLENEFYGKYCGCDDVIAQCVGHTHIDVAWLWTLAQTREKTVRSFSTVLNLMKEYPEYIFMSSQPQLYKFIKEEQPELYEEIKSRISEGRWEPEGGMWLEADCNLSSGESLVRQVLFGTRFFEKEFGVKNEILWLPDVFGYSAALPQILKKSGINYFMTTKISWNEYNKMPYDTFMWKGMDGTEILTHFITACDYEQLPKSHFTTYNGDIVPSQVMGSWKRYQQKGINNEVLISFGHGDGGGGPTRGMLENARRMEKGIPGCPKVQIGKSGDFFKRLEEKVSENNKLPKWVGELYLEYHRGTYTSMARNKKYNRKNEFLYQDAELLSSMGSLLTDGFDYPQEGINCGWETILLNQFHDILPGSSIKEVYEDSREQYVELLEKGTKLVGQAVRKIASDIGLEKDSIIVFNQLGFDRSDVVEAVLPEGVDLVQLTDAAGNTVAAQVVEDNGCKKIVFFAENVPSKGYKVFALNKMSGSSLITGNAVFTQEKVVSNRFFDIKFDENYNIVSLFDKLNSREVLKNGQKANALQAFEDKPHNWDAWDINIYYQEKMWEVNDVESAEMVENGPVRTVIRIRRKFVDSTITQDICIYNHIPKIDFKNNIDWKEKHILLKAAFPVDVHTDKATYEIQYGNVERPTHWNTSWDYARFEVCAHKWADLSEDNYGVSLMNDCKYGHDIKDGTMRLTLLKSPEEPNTDADREVHEFTYSIYPHEGTWKEAGTVQMAYNLNCPMYAVVERPHEGKLPKEFSMAKVDKENVVIEVVKKAEDSEELVVRLYECYNRRTKAKLDFFKKLGEVWECDLMENNICRLDTEGNSFEFEILPYEIKTFKLAIK